MPIVAIITTILQIIDEFLLPNLGSTSVAAKVITLLEQIIPVVIKEAQDLIPIIKNIIASLRGSGVVTPEQLDQLDAAEAKLDADFDTAAGNATT